MANPLTEIDDNVTAQLKRIERLITQLDRGSKWEDVGCWPTIGQWSDFDTHNCCMSIVKLPGWVDQKRYDDACAVARVLTPSGDIRDQLSEIIKYLHSARAEIARRQIVYVDDREL